MKKTVRTIITMTVPKFPRTHDAKDKLLSLNYQASAQSTYCISNEIDVTTECQQ